MFTEKNIETIRGFLLEAFPSYSDEKREKMLDDLMNRYTNPIPFCMMNGMHIARIGVRYELGNGVKGSYYYATEFDSELLDL